MFLDYFKKTKLFYHIYLPFSFSIEDGYVIFDTFWFKSSYNLAFMLIFTRYIVKSDYKDKTKHVY